MTVATKSRSKAKRESPRYPKIGASLSISGFACEPEEITDILGVQPTTSQHAGDPIRPGNRILLKQHFWVLRSSSRSRTSLAEHLKSISKALGAAIAKFQKLPPECTVYVSCSIFDVERSVVIDIPSEIVMTFAKMGAGISIDYYDMTPDEDR